MATRTTAKKSGRVTKKQLAIIDARHDQTLIETMEHEGGMMYAPVRPRVMLPALLIEPVTLTAKVLKDGTYKNVDNTAGKCERCNRGVMHKAVFVKRDGHVFGPECVVFYDKVKEVVKDGDEALRVVKHQFKLRMRYLTLAGMQKKGLLKGAPVTAAPIATAQTPDEVAAITHEVQKQLVVLDSVKQLSSTPDSQRAAELI